MLFEILPLLIEDLPCCNSLELKGPRELEYEGSFVGDVVDISGLCQHSKLKDKITKHGDVQFFLQLFGQFLNKLKFPVPVPKALLLPIDLKVGFDFGLQKGANLVVPEVPPNKGNTLLVFDLFGLRNQDDFQKHFEEICKEKDGDSLDDDDVCCVNGIVGCDVPIGNCCDVSDRPVESV